MRYNGATLSAVATDPHRHVPGSGEGAGYTVNRKVSVEQLQSSLEETIERVYDRGDEVIVERDGKPVAAVVPIREYNALRRSKNRFWELVDQIRAENRDADPAEVEAEVEQAIQEVRAGRRRKGSGVKSST